MSDNPDACLTSIQIATGRMPNWDKIYNAEISWNENTPQYSSSECVEYRGDVYDNVTYYSSSGSSSAGGTVGGVFGALCFLGCGWAIWFFFFRRTGNKDTELKPRTPTPDAPAQQTTTTTTIIQQQP